MERKNKIDNFYKMISVSIKRHLNHKVEIEYSVDMFRDLSNENIDYIASIEINGSLHGDLFLFTCRESLKFMFKTVFGIEYEDLEKDDLIQDCLNEFLNSIVANSTELFSSSNFPIEFGIPHKKNIHALIDLFQEYRYGIKIKSDRSSFILIFVNKN